MITFSQEQIWAYSEAIYRLEYRFSLIGLSVLELSQLDTLKLLLKSTELVVESERRQRAHKKLDARQRKLLEREREPKESEHPEQTVAASRFPNVHVRWHDWKSSHTPEPVDLPICEVDEVPCTPAMILDTEMNARAFATMSWAPWERRKRFQRSRRYEGYRAGGS